MGIRSVALSFALLAATVCRAQLGTEGSILGIVHDASGGSVAGASVTVTNTDTGLKNTVSTDESGYFQVLALPTGTYSVEVSASGFVRPSGRSPA